MTTSPRSVTFGASGTSSVVQTPVRALGTSSVVQTPVRTSGTASSVGALYIFTFFANFLL